MSKLQWYFNRLRAMNLPEVGWRLQQKHLQRQEKKLFGKRDVAVTAYLFDSRLQSLKFDSDHVGLNFRNTLPITGSKASSFSATKTLPKQKCVPNP